MDYKILGKTGIIVSRLCFGSLTVGPLQANLKIEEGAKIIANAIEQGINFIDTAKLYNNYAYIRRAIEITKRKDIVVSSRSYDYTYDGMMISVHNALDELGVKQIDIFGLHEQESIHTLRGHSDAFKFLIEAKESGIIKAISVSTHNVSVVEAVCSIPYIDVIHPILNYKGLGIGDGTVEDMLLAIRRAKQSGKGIYTMKPIGGGNLIESVETCFKFVLENGDIDSIAVGMQSDSEVDANIALFEGNSIPSDILNKLRNTKRRLLIDSWCQGCGNCVDRCSSGALKIINGKCIVNMDLCKLCSYCSTVCPEFCIKII